MKHFILLLFIGFSAPFLNAQSDVDISIQLLTPDLIGKVILDQDEFIEWVKLINEDIRTTCANVKGNKDVLVTVTIHSNKDATITTFSNPKVQTSIMNGLQTKLDAHTSPRSKFNEYCFLVSAKINKGAPPEGNQFPAQFLPYEQKMEAFRNLSLYEKQQDIQLWMKTDILPLLAYYETNVDSVYAGVLSLGNLVNEGEFLQESTEHITDENPDYWRATMEMSKGNQLIPFTKACMFIANGEFDKARRILDVIRFFYDDTTLPAKLDEQISDKLDLYTSELEAEINKGIAYHDAGKYDDAIKLYDNLLKEHPNSAWLNYERYFSQSAKEGMDIEGDLWKIAKQKVYACDPMYPFNAQAKTGKEGYELYRRQEIKELFTKKEELRSDFAKYADIALDLKCYGFAAQVYWLTLSHLKAEDYNDRDLLAHFLYCIDQLGDKETIDNFKDDYTEKFAEIEAERKELMEDNFMYKALKKDD